jgi:predicted nucleic acid-binding protein
MTEPPVVIDASVAIKWVVQEADSDLARALAGRDMLAPELLRLECLSAIWRRIVQRELTLREAPVLLRLLEAIPIRLRAIDEYLDEVLRLSVLLTHPVYDCAYLALALLNGTHVVTADRRFAKAVRLKPGVAGSIMLLTETAH